MPTRSRASPQMERCEPGLFGIKSTGVSTAPVRKAAEHVPRRAHATSSAPKTMFRGGRSRVAQVDEPAFLRAPGCQLQGNDRRAARSWRSDLLRAALSAKGLKLSRDIMRLNQTLGELNNNDFDQYGEWLYYITVMGKPSAKEPWGFQLDGHHADHQLFRAGRSGGDDSVVCRLRAGRSRTSGQISGRGGPAGRAAPVVST